MSVYPVRTPDPNDLTLAQATDAASKDFDRLRQIHAFDWQFNPWSKQVTLICACDHNPRTLDGAANHVVEAIRKERGPIRGPQKPK